MASWPATAPKMGGPCLSAGCSRAGGGSPYKSPARRGRRPTLGLPKEFRLRHRKDFDSVFKNGQAFNDKLLVLRILPNDLDHNRYGFVTSKRLGKAVTRNRVRRRLREIVRETPATAGYDVVLSAKTTAADAVFADLTSSVLRLYGRAGIAAAPDGNA
jgi:ribonuclease P protein component